MYVHEYNNHNNIHKHQFEYDAAIKNVGSANNFLVPPNFNLWFYRYLSSSKDKSKFVSFLGNTIKDISFSTHLTSQNPSENFVIWSKYFTIFILKSNYAFMNETEYHLQHGYWKNISLSII